MNTNPQSNATHTPWYVNPKGFVVTSTGEIVTRLECCESDKQATAQFIVRACNSHAQLVAALEAAKSLLERNDLYLVNEAGGLYGLTGAMIEAALSAAR